MVCEVCFKTKDELKEAVDSGIDFYIKDLKGIDSKMFLCSDIIIENERVIVTCNQMENYIATIKRENGKLVVK